MADYEERDLVINPNEFAYVLDKTKGLVSCMVGPYKMPLGNSDALVIFNNETKRYEEANQRRAVQTFVIAPENWYIQLKNPSKEGTHPTNGANLTPELNVGKKVNIRGNAMFALYPGQMAKVIPGHKLHSNQYLLARVYDPEALKQSNFVLPGAVEKGDGEKKDEYVTGQILVIKGTDVPFFIPPTGIEVLPIGGKGDNYIRDAVTLGRLEYCILRDESGNDSYVHGPAVVFPRPDQQFVKTEDGERKYSAIELSEISGIYVKVIKEYSENGKVHHVGDELFITGKEQMIYYPREEHSIIQYSDKKVHHAIAIPEGEGRYVLNRLSGDIRIERGPKMFLPDPKTEVIVKRKLSKSQCQLWYPGNKDVLDYNLYDRKNQNDDYEEDNRRSRTSVSSSAITRNTTFTEPRFIVFDDKFSGVVQVEVFTGYAINVVSKKGNRKVIEGPKTYLMEYDETLEVLALSTGKPKTTDNLERTVYLRTNNNKISDIIGAQTKDFVDVSIKVSYCVDFRPEYKEKWFSVDNFVKYLCDRIRSLLKAEIKKYDIEEFYANSSDIVRAVVLGERYGVMESAEQGDGESEKETTQQKEGKEITTGRLFTENGMWLYDVDVLSVKIEDYEIAEMISRYQQDTVRNNLRFLEKQKETALSASTMALEAEDARLKDKYKREEDQLRYERDIQNKNYQESLAQRDRDEELREQNARKETQKIEADIRKAEEEMRKASAELDNEIAKEQNARLIERQEAGAKMVRTVMESISDDLIASMTSSANAELLQSLATNISPLAIAKGESVADVTNTLLRGTSMENAVAGILRLAEGKKTEDNEDVD